MATTASTYPKIGTSAWVALRVRAVATPSYKSNATAVAVIIGHDSAKSAGLNVVSPMQRLGLLDEHGNLTERGHKWRGDDTYAEACQEILDDIYPADLSGFTTATGSPDKAMVRFMADIPVNPLAHFGKQVKKERLARAWSLPQL
jgi:hypothetical protein